ncbi:hypothetical protein I7I53_04570 [Histoplasma capsulatum var. duboisii H88]|uniref:Uncharacterized protein n=1 Tax=Ajellomyces capsulatus (strain H88) TaxID=544711 RepID=A0A8A1LQ27_AJEC8|nr:hypothetical protein I7I53_04570 [Histoplasma capsulatum var. duboisii H88]
MTFRFEGQIRTWIHAQKYHQLNSLLHYPVPIHILILCLLLQLLLLSLTLRHDPGLSGVLLRFQPSFCNFVVPTKFLLLNEKAEYTT